VRDRFKIVVIAGPNGAGKTTFAKEYLPQAQEMFVYLNADEIARRLELSAIGAGRKMLTLIDHHVDLRDDIMLETTLAGQNYLKRIPNWQTLGYDVQLYYLRLPNVEASIRRVQQRVEAGGHSIPEAAIRKRFQRSLVRLEEIKNLVDDWYVYDSLEGKFQFVESWVAVR
jgi:predicted ABC-type ATPase